jgi:Integrase core domain
LQIVPGSKSPEDSNLDPFAPENLRLDQSSTETVGVKRLLTTIPVRKPKRQEFFRTHPGPDYRDVFSIIEQKEDNEEYIVTRLLVPELASECISKMLRLAVNRQGVLFFLPLRLPGPDGDRPISPRSPWQNPYVERLIGTLRRECLDHVPIFGGRHLQGVLTAYSAYYNERRTHL